MMTNIPTSNKPLVAVIDDSASSRSILRKFLITDYRVCEAENGQEGIKLIQEEHPDVVLLDVVMPGEDGMTVCKEIKKNPRTNEIPVIFLTSLEDIEYKTKGFEVGASDYITKPFILEEVQLRIQNVLSIIRAKLVLADQNERLDYEVQKRTREIENTKNVMIRTLAALAETRDNDTGEHILRTQHYIKSLAKKAIQLGYFRDELSDEIIDIMYRCAPLHDIGKVGINDAILLKPGKLTPEEFEIMKTHTTLGYDVMLLAEKDLGETLFIKYTKDIIISHHEKWDGSGYPKGLAEDAIPLVGRFMALADVYDALISKRVYKEAFSHNNARSIIIEGKGTHFDPRVVECFEAGQNDFRRIANEYSDKEVTVESLYGKIK